MKALGGNNLEFWITWSWLTAAYETVNRRNDEEDDSNEQCIYCTGMRGMKRQGIQRKQLFLNYMPL